MNQKNKELGANAEWAKSRTSWQAAEVLMQAGFRDDAVSRYYYAAFHAAKAILLTEGLEESSHKGLMSLFGLHFIKSGKIDAKFSRILSHSQKDREDADYLSDCVFTPQNAEERRREVRLFLDEAERYLKTNGFLKK